MALTKFEGNVNVISGLDDSPKLTAAELKAKFDFAGEALKEYLNTILTEQLDQKLLEIDSLSSRLVEQIKELEGVTTQSRQILAELQEAASWLRDESTVHEKAISSLDYTLNQKITTYDSAVNNLYQEVASLHEGIAWLDGRLSALVVNDFVDSPHVALSAQMGRALAINKQPLIGTGTAVPSGGSDGDLYIRY